MDAEEIEKRDPARPTRQQVKAMWKAGVPVRRIAMALDIATQRVYQHLDALEESGEIVRPQR